MLVTTLDETKRLPTRLITLPMTAVSRGLQAGMRLQQNIAEMAIKGDEFFAPYCEQAEEQPSWARFDEDEQPAAAPVPPTTLAKAAAKTPRTGSATRSAAPKSAEAKSAAAKPATAKKPARKAAPAKSTAAKSTAKPAADAEPPAASAGRFALYSSPPADLAPAAEPSTNGATKPAPTPAATTGGTAVPEVAESLEYDSLTLAQLRAKLRGLSTEDLEALAAYERAGRGRAPFLTMLDNRIASHQKKSGASQ